MALPGVDVRLRRTLQVVHVLPSTDDAGAEHQARYQIRALRGADLDVAIAFFRLGRAHGEFERMGIPLHDLGSRGPLVFDCRRRARRLAEVARGADIIHTWLYEAAVVGALAVRGGGLPRLVIGQRSGAALGQDRTRMMVMGRIRSHVHHAIANSDHGRAILLRAGYAADRVSVIRNVVPPETVVPFRAREAVRAELGVPMGDSVVCAVARMDDAKDLHGLIRAMAIVTQHRPSARLLLVGPEPGELRDAGIQAPENAIVVGWQSHPADFMSASDVVAISSWSEGHSNVADEAMLLGLPVATTDVGGHPRLVGRTGGRVVPPRRPELLASAILGLLDDPPSAQRVRTIAEAELSPALSTALTLNIYERVLSAAED